MKKASIMGAIMGAVAAAYYNEIPNYLYDFTMSKVPIDLRRVIEQFDRKITEAIE